MKSPTESNLVDQNFALNINGSNQETPIYLDIEDTVRVINNNHVVRGKNWHTAKQRKSHKADLAGPNEPTSLLDAPESRFIENDCHNTQ